MKTLLLCVALVMASGPALACRYGMVCTQNGNRTECHCTGGGVQNFSVKPKVQLAACTTYIDTYSGQLKTQCVRDNPDGTTRMPQCTTVINPTTGYPEQHCY